MKTIEERIREQAVEELKNDIIQQLTSVIYRVQRPAAKDRIYFVEIRGQKISWNDLVRAIEQLMFDQEIEQRVDKAIESFMFRVKDK